MIDPLASFNFTPDCKDLQGSYTMKQAALQQGFLAWRIQANLSTKSGLVSMFFTQIQIQPLITKYKEVNESSRCTGL